MGGHYTPHYDYLIVDRPPEERHLVSDMEKFAGDRIATLMFYVSTTRCATSQSNFITCNTPLTLHLSSIFAP